MAVAVALMAVALTTRLLSGRTASTTGAVTTPPPMPGYWVPYVGHSLHVSFQDAGRFLARLAGAHPGGAVSLQLMGQQHTFVHDRDMARALDPSSGDGRWFAERLVVSGFGLLSSYKSALRQVLELAVDTSDLASAATHHLVASIADLVSFNSYADQMEWERLADADTVGSDGGDETHVEANLMDLVGAFTAQSVTSALLGTNFATNFPEFPGILARIDSGMSARSSWSQKARSARRQGQWCLYEFHDALDKHLAGQGVDPGVRWQDMDDVSGLIRERAILYRNLGLSLSARAAIDLAVAWELSSQVGMLTSWMAFELYRDLTLLAQLRAETGDYVRCVQPENGFGTGVWIAPSVSIDTDSLVARCLLLRSAYVETVRLYTCTGSSMRLKEDVTVPRVDKGSYLLRQGTYVDTAQEMYNLDERRFASPDEWQGGRHIKDGAVDMDAATPYGESARHLLSSTTGTDTGQGMFTPWRVTAETLSCV
ncbi:Cytochrome P450 [Geosmithia morbida]|uniref:Cytochrome P450 n=1 Tax=Geosmithia morbida TaxID=1094350 RepID=A0A9P4Z060_9HYPO|nr:Cytochrome P450 [Geosmithia morbida]KAF4126105.1 Cytochrome P450 [Geosmithia morbida]